MSQLSEAKKRMFTSKQKKQDDIQVFTRSKTNLTDLNKYIETFDKQHVKNRQMHFNQLYSFNKIDSVANMVKTDRWKQSRNLQQNEYDTQTQRPNQISLLKMEAKKKNRRTTTFSRQHMSPTINDVSFTEKQDSMYDNNSQFKQQKQRRQHRYPYQYQQNATQHNIYGVSGHSNINYNQSPIKQLKQTIHHQKLNLIIANQQVRVTLSPIKPKECDQRATQQLIKAEKSKADNFVDSMFPPTFGIIYNKRYMYTEEGLRFERLPKIYDRQKLHLIKFCEPTYLTMGKYSSSSVYSALSILSEEPQLVLSLFQRQQISHNGIYYVNICKDGVWRYIVIDDLMPIKFITQRSLMFLHSYPQNNAIEIWASLAQKALAKVYGTYQDLYLTSHRGIKQIFNNLTGFPVSQFSLNKDFRSFLVLIDAAIKKRHIVVLQDIKQQYQETAHVKKLETGFSYKIIEIKKNHIVLRNLNDRQIITRLSFQQAAIFCRLLIFRWQKNYVYQSRTMLHKNGYYSAISFSIKQKQPVKGYFSLYQNSQVYYKKHIGSHIGYHHHPFTILLVNADTHITQKQSNDKISSKQQKYQSDTGIKIEIGKQTILKSGEYRLLSHVCQDKQMNYTVSFYGQKQLTGFDRIKCNQKWNISCQCSLPQQST